MTKPTSDAYVSRGGDKLAAALDHFAIDVSGCTCADFGSHVGGFVDCLLQRGAKHVHAIDTCYGTLAWKLRRDPRVTVHERTNAMHVSLTERVDLVTIDAGWTTQSKIFPNVQNLIERAGSVVTLIKPHYEAGRVNNADGASTAQDAAGIGRKARRTGGRNQPGSPLVEGVLPDEDVDRVVKAVLERIVRMGWVVMDTMFSPIRGHGGNREVFAHCKLQSNWIA